MPKNIVFLADGTWDEPSNNSNVQQLYSALDNIPGVQVTTYDSGVGTDGTPIDKLLGGAFGAGLFGKIKDGYSAISASYATGDRISLFGFSRGAFTARSLAGMIAICGLPTVNQKDSRITDMAFEAYRNASERSFLLGELNAAYRMEDARIQLLGVWDTVGSLGIPAIFGDSDPVLYGFLDTSLHPDVLNAVQALAIDEQRQQFQPCLWTSPPAHGQSVTQCWFAGVHCDVGGGYSPDPGGGVLSLITLRWMGSFAAGCGLRFKAGMEPLMTLPSPPLNALAKLNDSRTGAYRIFPPHIRSIDASAMVASSVQARCANAASKYAPQNLHLVPGPTPGTHQLASTYQIANVL